MRTRVCALTLGFLGMTGLASGAQAQCIICSCSASVPTPVSFGSYNPTSTVDLDIAGRITLSCLSVAVPTTIAVSIALNAGTGSGGSFTPRRMRFGATNTLNYNLFTTAGRTTIWGTGTGGSSVRTDSIPLSLLGTVSRSYDVFGRIPSGQNVPPGLYTDTVTVTFTF